MIIHNELSIFKEYCDNIYIGNEEFIMKRYIKSSYTESRRSDIGPLFEQIVGIVIHAFTTKTAAVLEEALDLLSIGDTLCGDTTAYSGPMRSGRASKYSYEVTKLADNMFDATCCYKNQTRHFKMDIHDTAQEMYDVFAFSNVTPARFDTTLYL